MATKGLKFKITRNSLAGLIRFVIAFPILFFLTPYVLQKLGPELFGVWALIGAVGAVIQLSEMGLNITLLKFVAETLARNDRAALNYLVNTAIVIQGGLAILISAPIVIFRQFLVVQVLQVPPDYVVVATIVLAGSAGVYAIRIVLNAFSATLSGFQRMDLSHSLALLFTICNAGGVYIFLKFGWGLAGMVMANAVATLVFGVIARGAVRQLLPEIRLKLSYWRAEIAKQLFAFGWPVQVSYLSGLGLTPLHKLILTRSAGVDAVAHYEIANQVSSQIRGLFVQAILPLVPAASALQASQSRRSLWSIYRRVWRYLWIFAFPIFWYILLIAAQFITAWLGDAYPEAVFALQAIIIAQWFSLLVTPLYFMLQGIGLVRHTMLISGFTGGFSALLSLILGYMFGFQGVVVGFGLTYVFSAWFTYWVFQSKVYGSYRDLSTAIGFRNSAILILSGLGLWAGLRYWFTPTSLMALVGLGIGFLSLYGVILFFGRGLRVDDFSPLQDILPVNLYNSLLKWGRPSSPSKPL